MTQFNFMEEKELMEKGDKIIEMQKDLRDLFFSSLPTFLHSSF